MNTDETMTLKDWMNLKCSGYLMENDGFSDKIHSLKVVEEYKSWQVGFPQTKNNHRNVHVWVLLEDGSVVGMNESPRVGVSFPRVGKKTVQRIYPWV